MNLLITKDNNDDKLGNFFEKCARLASLSFKDIAEIKILSSRELKNGVVFNMTVTEYHSSSFNFFAFTHGHEDGLLVEDENYADFSENNRYWVAANFIYNFSCLSGCNFGKKIVENGAKCFVGHNKTIFIHTLPKYQEYFYKPFETFINNLSENKSVEECLQLAKEKYTEGIDALYTTDMFLASILLDNRDSLVLHGNPKVKM